MEPATLYMVVVALVAYSGARRTVPAEADRSTYYRTLLPSYFLLCGLGWVVGSVLGING